MWELFKADVRLYRLLRYSNRSAAYGALALFFRPGGLVVLFTHRLSHALDVNRATQGWTFENLLLRFTSDIAKSLRVLFSKSEMLDDTIIEKNVYLSDGGYLVMSAKRIGSGTVIHERVTMGMNLQNRGKPTIGENVWIGSNTVIFGSITVGDGVTIMPDTVLSKSVPANCVVGGNPARILKRDFDNSELRHRLNCKVEALFEQTSS